ncbi:hypothetical protein C8J57DRAFT_1536992 [Mycena rebaudengoi]|nr:hypothetical protein C8J57DRAFT_1536992 [Mycena rebaudengoi]
MHHFPVLLHPSALHYIVLRDHNADPGASSTFRVDMPLVHSGTGSVERSVMGEGEERELYQKKYEVPGMLLYPSFCPEYTWDLPSFRALLHGVVSLSPLHPSCVLLWHVPYGFPFSLRSSGPPPFAQTYSTILSPHPSTAPLPRPALLSASRRIPPVLAVPRILTVRPTTPKFLARSLYRAPPHSSPLVYLPFPPHNNPPLRPFCLLYYISPPLPRIQRALRQHATSHRPLPSLPLHLFAFDPLLTFTCRALHRIPIPSHPRLVPLHPSHSTPARFTFMCPRPYIRVIYESHPDYLLLISYSTYQCC